MAEQCRICGSMREVLTKNHLKEHGITMIEYRAKYGTAAIISTGIPILPKEAKVKLAAEKREDTNGKQGSPRWVRGGVVIIMA